MHPGSLRGKTPPESPLQKNGVVVNVVGSTDTLMARGA